MLQVSVNNKPAKPMETKREVNIRAVAGRAGVSIAAVSRALNRKPNVSKAMSAKVERACAELGYKLNPCVQDFIRKGRNGVTRNLAYVIVADSISSPTYARSLDGMAEAVETFNYNLSLTKISGQEHGVFELPPLLRDGRIDGMLLTGALNESIVSILQKCGKPIVILGDYPKSVCVELPCVALDFDASLFKMVKTLKDMGRTRIAIFHTHPNPYQEQTANRAYIQALTDCGLPVDKRLIFKSESVSPGAIVRDWMNILSGPRLPFDSAICCNYPCANAASHLIFAHAVRRGEAPSELLAILWPLGSFSLPVPALYFDLMFKEAATRGAAMLIDILTGKDSHQGQRIGLAAQMFADTSSENQGARNEQ